MTMGNLGPSKILRQLTSTLVMNGTPEKIELWAQVLCLGKASRLSNLFHEQTSIYTGVIRLGEATDTYDSTGRVTASLGWDHITGE